PRVQLSEDRTNGHRTEGREGALRRDGARRAQGARRESQGGERHLLLQDLRRRRRRVDGGSGERAAHLHPWRHRQGPVHDRGRARGLQADAREPADGHAALLPGQAPRHRRPHARHQAAAVLRDRDLMPAPPLEGVRVLDLSRLLPGPFLTLILADLGADVVKVEDPRLGDYLRGMPPHVDGMSARFRALNRDKRSIALDLKAPAGRDAFLRMAERTDVVVESFRPGVLDKLGVGYAALSARNARIVVCSISGYGKDGPYRDRAGHDLNYIPLPAL